MASGRSLNLSEETFDFLCTACEHDGKLVEAVRYCKECQGYCCQDCTNTHKRFPALKRHCLLAATQGTPGSNRPASLSEFSTERCCTHQDKVIDMYCQHHDVVCCRSCVSKDHRSCPNSQIYSIPDMVDKLFSLSDCQTVSHILRQLIDSMTSFGESKDDQLKALKAAKDEAVQMIATFRKTLEAVIKKAADMSRQELDDVYKKLEKEILQDKSVIDKTNDDLKIIKTKISRAEVNRVQKFVCTKIAKENIIDAESMVAEKEKNSTGDRQLSFTPNQSILNDLVGLQGIGQIGIPMKQKTDLYKIRGSHNIRLKVADDSNTSCILDCCLTYDNKIFVTDMNNDKLKRINIDKLKVVDYCKVDRGIVGVCCVSKNEAVVTFGVANKIQFISIGDKMIPTIQIEMSHCCWGIASMGDKLYITDYKSTLYVHDMVGNLLNIITHGNAGNKLFSDMYFATVNKRKNNLYVCDQDKGVVCFDNLGNYLSTISDLKNVGSVCFDERRNMFAVGAASMNVVQFNEDGKKIGVVIRQQDGLREPASSACFLPSQNMLFVAMDSSDVMKMFELE